MKIQALLTCFFLTNFFQVSLTLICSDLEEEKQCNQLETEGCTWSGIACSGSYSPSCVPPNCYYIDGSSTSTETPDGTVEKPFRTLSDGLTKASGKDGLLIIINTLDDSSVAVTKAATISSEITIRPLFEDKKYTIDFSQIPSSLRAIWTITGSLKLIKVSLNLQISFGVLIFNVNLGRLYFENVEVKNTPLGGTHTFVRTIGRAAMFSMVNGQFEDAKVTFIVTGGTSFWKNVSASGENTLQNTLSASTGISIEDCFFTGD